MKSRILMVCAVLLFPVLALGQAATPPPPGAPPPAGGDVFHTRTIRLGQASTPPPGSDVFYTRTIQIRKPGDLGAWWKDSEIVRQLQLSDAQVSQIEQTFLDARLKLINLRADVEIQEALLQPLVDADQMDEAKISVQLDKLLAARSKLEKANTMMMFDIRKVLTVEQWKKLQGIQHERERMRMGPPPGGPRGPGMPGPPEGPGPATAPPPGDDDL